MHDKLLHFLEYLILVFLLWFAISPDGKVRWSRTAVWRIVFVLACYGALDELLQAYAGRSCDLTDFLANMVGVLTGLIMFSIFSFWSAGLVVTGITVFLLPALAGVNLARLVPATSATLHLLAYGFFSLVWTKNMPYFLPQKPPQLKWIVVALSVPICFLLAVKLFSLAVDKGFVMQDVIVSVVAVTAVVIGVSLIALFRRRFGREISADDSEGRV
jgi:hypothetical protein